MYTTNLNEFWRIYNFFWQYKSYNSFFYYKKKNVSDINVTHFLRASQIFQIVYLTTPSYSSFSSVSEYFICFTHGLM